MKVVSLEGNVRESGKREARRLRRSGRVPCILYGRDDDSIAFDLDELALNRLVYTDELHRLELSLGKKKYDCILKMVDFHPYQERAIHADFQMLHAGQEIQLTVPVQFVGKSKGQIAGGEVQVLTHDLEIRCLPKDIPDNIEIDLTPLEIGDTVHVEDIKIPGVEFVTPASEPIVAVTEKRILEIEVEEVEEEGLVEEGAEGEAEEAAAAEGES